MNVTKKRTLGEKSKSAKGAVSMPTDLTKARQLFGTFSKIGAFTFGGGYAMIPLIQREMVDNKGWISEKDILEIVAISESTPGPIAVNSATFVGYQVGGVMGSFLATLGVVLPSFVIILAISFVLKQFEQLKAVKYAFWGIRAGVLALIIKGFISMYKQCPKNVLSYVIAALAFAASAVFSFNVLIIIISAAAIGLAATIISQKEGKTL